MKPLSPQVIAGVLIDACNRIADPSHWCQGNWATDVTCEAVEIENRAAERFCAGGAVRKELMKRTLCYGIGASHFLDVKRYLDLAVEDMKAEGRWEGDICSNFTGILGMNDYGTHVDVLTAFARAVAFVEESYAGGES